MPITRKKKLWDPKGWGREEVMALSNLILGGRHFTNRELIVAMERICSHLTQLSQMDVHLVTISCRLAIDRIAELQESELGMAGWVSLLTVMSSHNSISEMKKQNDDDDIEFNICVELTADQPLTDISHEVLAVNKIRIVSSGLLCRIMKMWIKNGRERNGSGDNDDSMKSCLERASLVRCILESKWSSLGENDLSAIKDAVLSAMLTLVNHASSTDIAYKRLVMSTAASVHQAVLLVGSDAQFSRSLINLYGDAFDMVKKAVILEELVSSLLLNLPLLSDVVITNANMKLLWKVLIALLDSLQSGEGEEETEEESCNSSQFLFRFDTWLNETIASAVASPSQDTTCKRANVCREVISALTVHSKIIQISLEGFQSAIESCARIKNESGPSLANSLCKLSWKLVDENIINQNDQIAAVECLLSLWEKGNPTSLSILLSSLLTDGSIACERVVSHILSLTPPLISDPWCMQLLREAVHLTKVDARALLLERVVKMVVSLNSTHGPDCDSAFICSLLHASHVLVMSNSSFLLPLSHFTSQTVPQLNFRERRDDSVVDLSIFNGIVASEEYSQALEIFARSVFSLEMKKMLCLSMALPPINSIFSRKMVAEEKSRLSQVLHFVSVDSLLRGHDYKDMLMMLNGDSQMPQLIEKWMEQTTVDRFFLSVLEYLSDAKKQHGQLIMAKMSWVAEYVLKILKDATIDLLSMKVLNHVAIAIGSVELSFVLDELSSNVNEREEAKRRVKKVIQIYKCNILPKEEKAKLLEVLKMEVAKAMMLINEEYEKEGEKKKEGPLSLHQSLLSILRFHLRKKKEILNEEMLWFIHSYLPELKGEKSHFGVRSLLMNVMGALCESPLKKLPFECTPASCSLNVPVYSISPLIDRFYSLMLCICSDKPSMSSLPWDEVEVKDIGRVFQKCGDEGGGMSVSVAVLSIFEKIIEGKNISQSARRLFVSFIEECGTTCFLHLLSTSKCKMSLFIGLSPVLTFLSSNVQHHSQLGSFLVAVIPILFHDPINDLVQHIPIEVQATDRFAQTHLKWRCHETRMDGKECELENPVRKTISILSSFPLKEVHLKLLFVLADKLKEWSQLDVHEEEMVLRGINLLNGNSLIWRMELLSEAFSFFAQMGKSMGMKKDKEDGEETYYSDVADDTNEETNEEKNTKEREPIPLCTFVSTEKEFTKQHWYNCHTCNMVDTVGVCSVCAVNCHRGHELSYSKLGSFFCDCGERGCMSMKETKHRVYMGEVPREKKKNIKKIRMIHENDKTHSSQLPCHLTIKEFLKAYDWISEKVEECKDVLGRMIAAVDCASEGKWSLSERRKGTRNTLNNAILKYDECIMTMRICESEGLDSLDRKMESGERVPHRECTAMIRMDEGASLLAFINDTRTLTLVYSTTATFNDASQTRVQRESIAFVPRRISAKDDCIIVTGSEEVLLIRIDVHTCDVVQRLTITLPDNPSANPIVKAIWAPGGGMRIAVATLQFVRIYDTCRSTSRFECELVLPMGNVVDVSFVEKTWANDYSWLLVLCSAGHVYFHQLGGPGPVSTESSNSLFLTCTLTLPSPSNSVSMWYSSICHTLLVSLQSGTYFAYVHEGDVSRLESSSFRKLEIDVESVCGWSESEGVISALSYPVRNKVIFIYPTLSQVLIQCTLLPHNAHSLCMTLSPTRDSIIALALLSGYRRAAMLFHSNWSNQPDLWIKELPRCIVKMTTMTREEKDEVSDEDLVTILEGCEELKDVEYTSRALSVYYDSVELTERLKTPGSKAVSIVENNDFDITLRLTKWHFVLRAIRIEVNGGRGPKEVTVLGRRINLQTNATERVFDIPLRPSQMRRGDKSIQLMFKCNARDSPTSIVSIRAYGENGGESTLASQSIITPPPACLSSLFVENIMKLLTEMKLHGIALKDIDWMSAMALKVSSPRSYCPSLSSTACQLLRVITPSKDEYYEEKDKMIILTLSKFRSGSPNIPSLILSDFIDELKNMMTFRFEKMLEIVASSPFSDMLSLCCFLREELEGLELSRDESVLDSLVLLYTHLVVLLVASRHEQRKNMIDDLIGMTRTHSTARVTSRLHEHLSSFLIASSSTTSSSSPSHPFFPIERIMKNVPPTDDDWRLVIIRSLVDKLYDDTLLSLPSQWVDQSSPSWPSDGEGILEMQEEVSMSDGLSSMTICIARLVSQESLTTIVSHIIQLLKTSTQSTMTKGDNMRVLYPRQFILLNLLHSLVSKEKKRKKRKEKEEKEEEEDESSGDECTVGCEAMKNVSSFDRDRVVCILADHSTASFLFNLSFQLISHSLTFWSKMKDGRKLSTLWPSQVVAPSEIDPLIHYYTALSRVVLRLAVHIVKIHPHMAVSTDKKRSLCEFLHIERCSNGRKDARRLLIAICGGSKELYKKTRDEQIMRDNLDMIRCKYLSKKELTHEMLTEMMERTTKLHSLAVNRVSSWRRICEKNLDWLLLLSCNVGDAVSVAVMELIQCATKVTSEGDSRSSLQPPPTPAHFSIADTLIESPVCIRLLKVLLIRHLIGRDESRRWFFHSITRSLMQLANRTNQISLQRILLDEVWPIGRCLGPRSSQLTDLLSAYLPSLLPSSSINTVIKDELNALEELVERTEKCGEREVVNSMSRQGLWWKDALLLNSDPCLDCIQTKDSFGWLKLSAMKGEARYTTTAQMFKLNSQYEMSKVTLKLTDVKKSRMFRRVNVYYTGKWVETAVELKGDRKSWKKVASCKVTSTDTELVMAVAIPIVTNGLVIEFAELGESRRQGELHCLRCSALVHPNPGVCDNCGENVFQCVKCRVINYDEKEPFLCSSCGYCKYARVEVSILCRPQPTLLPQPSEGERVATWRKSAALCSLVNEMEYTRGQMTATRSFSEALTLSPLCPPSISFPVESRRGVDAVLSALPLISSQQSRVAALSDTMHHASLLHDRLAMETSQLVWLREELRKEEEGRPKVIHSYLNNGYYSTNRECIGCLSSAMIHSLCLIRSLCMDDTMASLLSSHSLFPSRLLPLSSSIPPLKEELESLFVKLSCSSNGANLLCQLANQGQVSAMALGASVEEGGGPLWDQRLITLIKLAMNEDARENELLCVLNILLNWMNEGRRMMGMEEKEKRKKKREKEEESIDDTVMVDKGEIDNEGSLLNELEKEPFREHIYSLLWKCVFHPTLSIRSHSCRLIRSISAMYCHSGTALSITLRGLSLSRSIHPCHTHQFFLSCSVLLERGQVKLRLFAANFHLYLMRVILQCSREIGCIERREDGVEYSSCIILSHYTQLLCNMLSGSWLETCLISSTRLSLLLPLLHSIILLRRVTIKKTQGTITSLSGLEELLKRVTWKEGCSLVAAAVACLNEVEDDKSRADVVGVILDTLNADKNGENDEFLIQVEKDSAQEDFLQGRMQHNPYRSTDPTMGPSMRNIKDKICRESELIALLEDENGMELLVNGRIISLSLPVRLVYEKLWRPEHAHDAMVVVYRMRGLLGDAVEPFVDSLDEGRNGEEDEMSEEEGRLVRAFASAGGVEGTLSLLDKSTLTQHSLLLLVQLRKLMMILFKLESTRRELLEKGAVARILSVVRLLGEWKREEYMRGTGLHLLSMVEGLVCQPKHHPYLKGISRCQIEWLMQFGLSRRNELALGPTQTTKLLLPTMMRIIANAGLGSEDAEKYIVERFEKDLDWSDGTGTQNERTRWATEREFVSECYCMISDAILCTDKGSALKKKLIEGGVIEKAVNSLLHSHPPLYGTVESTEWKSFLGRPSLPFILRILKGIACGYETAQLEIAKRALPMLHRLEQVSSAEHVGTLAENVMETLKMSVEVASHIERVRLETKQKKRQLAMAMREKQLSRLGMQMGRSGEVKVSSRSIMNEPEVDSPCDPLTTCCICRESVLNGVRVPGTYAYASPLPSDTRRPPTHYSVSMIVMVHTDCHYNAIRRSTGGRNGDEWTKASLHNSGAKTNIVVPLAVANPSHSDWVSAVNRLHTDLEMVVPGAGPLTRFRVFLDMCNLVYRFIVNRPFAECSGGGGRESNMQYLGVLHLLALSLPAEALDCCHPIERMTSFLLTEHTLAHWNESRMEVLRAAIHGEEKTGVDGDNAMREALLQWAFIDRYFNTVIPIDGEDRLEWLKDHVSDTLKRTVTFVADFDSKLLTLNTNDQIATALEINLVDLISSNPSTPAQTPQ